MYEVKRFHCSYCTKVLSKKADMVRHEQFCPRNPESKSCGTCEHLRMVPQLVDHPEFGRLKLQKPVCELNQFRKDNRTARNPHGMRSNCPYHVTDPYLFDRD